MSRWREVVFPVLWLFAAAVLIGTCLGLSARAHADEGEPFHIGDLISPPADSRTPCVMLVPGEWVCPEGFEPPTWVAPPSVRIGNAAGQGLR